MSARQALLTESSSPTSSFQFDSSMEAQRRKDPREVVANIAYKISYAGAILLTADQVVRSVDSVMDKLKLEGEDGSSLRFSMRPSMSGFSVMVRLSRPIEF
jgi:hypothetical protein